MVEFPSRALSGYNPGATCCGVLGMQSPDDAAAREGAAGALADPEGLNGKAGATRGGDLERAFLRALCLASLRPMLFGLFGTRS